MPVFATDSQATLASGSLLRYASSTASLMRSHILSGCPSPTDSEVKRKLSSSPGISCWPSAGRTRSTTHEVPLDPCRVPISLVSRVDKEPSRTRTLSTLGIIKKRYHCIFSLIILYLALRTCSHPNWIC